MKFTSKEMLLNAIRQDIIGEFMAINQYSEHLEATDDPVAKEIWTGIRNEERVHVGELLTLLGYINPEEIKYFAEGEKEAQKIISEKTKS